ncbi:DUF4177 domain-containing protein [Pseudoxanthomonas putridarboris]|uniref:DUF4177 domain-containing protein n=1 Tax=Pseudoxanthomonas putridarboris TaxID=752605 RepID=A0ABU9J3S5_9GAMM
MSNRWSYQVVEMKARMMGGIKTDALQEELNKQGKLGWELVNIIHATPSITSPVLVFKKEA